MSTVDAVRLELARAFLERAVDEGAFPGVVALISLDDRTVAHWAIGHAEREPVLRPMQPNTIFDLASLTKPIAGATAALLLLEDGVWSLDDTVAHFIPQFGASGKAGVTLRQLLSHSSGMTAWAATYAFARDAEAALGHICDLPLTYAPGDDVQYSDVGYSLIGHLVRRVTGRGLDVLLRDRVWQPLGMSDTSYCPPPRLRQRIAATERGNRFEQVMVRKLGLTFDDWRNPDTVLVGEVNDGNTHYALGGTSSHAGLFSTAGDVLTFARMYLGGGAGILKPQTLAVATSVHTVGLAKSRGLGWEIASRNSIGPAPGRAYGDLLSAGTYAHTGFTGTSLVIDPELKLIVILLTNRIHPDATNDRIATVRPRFHNLIASAIGPSHA